MPVNPLEKAISRAAVDNKELKDLISQMGTSEDPTGYVHVAYRNAKRAMFKAVVEPDAIGAVTEVLDQLKTSITSELKWQMRAAQQIGMASALVQLDAFGIAVPSDRTSAGEAQIDAALDAALANLNGQEDAIRAMLLTGVDDAMITGDDDRQGVLQVGTLTAAIAFWLAALMNDAFDWTVDLHGRDRGFRKQAVAALDARTTDCCLRVHGQVVDLKSKFHLTGEPRYADYLDSPPFHWYCRTSQILYLPEYDDGLTAWMQGSAKKVLDERANGQRIDRHPADAFS
jgi:hypothetical protein